MDTKDPKSLENDITYIIKRAVGDQGNANKKVS